MHIERVPNRNSPPAVLLRQSYREGGKVRFPYSGKSFQIARSCDWRTANFTQRRHSNTIPRRCFFHPTFLTPRSCSSGIRNHRKYRIKIANLRAIFSSKRFSTSDDSRENYWPSLQISHGARFSFQNLWQYHHYPRLFCSREPWIYWEFRCLCSHVSWGSLSWIGWLKRGWDGRNPKGGVTSA